MSSNSSSSVSPTATQEEDDGLSQTEWIVIIVVLVIILIVLIIAIAKCLEFGRSPSNKSLIQQDEQSMRSETVRSTGTRSMASTRSRPKSMRKLPLNAEITRFSAGRVSRSAEYGVVIKDIKKTVQEPDTTASKISQPPGYTEQVNTLNTYRGDTLPPQTLSSPPTANLIVNEQYATQGLAPANSKAVFVAPDELYSTPRSIGPTTASNPNLLVQAPAPVVLDRSFPLLTQPAVLLQ